MLLINWFNLQIWITLYASSPVQTQVNNNFTTVHFLYVLYMYDVLWIII